jgi:hypothetical protein
MTNDRKQQERRERLKLEQKRLKAAEYEQAVEDERARDKMQEYYLRRLRSTPDHKLSREERYLKAGGFNPHNRPFGRTHARRKDNE